MKTALIALLAAGCIAKPARDPDRGAPGERTWKLVTGADQPGPLLSPRLTYDPASAHVYLFGGAFGGAVANKLWRLDGNTWNVVCDDCLGAFTTRYRSGFAADGGQFYVFGGVSDAGGIDQHAEVYTSPTGTKWDFFATTGAMPSARDQASLVAFHGKLYQAGGYGANVAKDDLSSLETDRWTVEPRNSANTGGEGTAVTVDSDHDRILAIQDNSGKSAADGLFAFDGAAWTNVCTTCTGINRGDASLVHIPGADATFIIGGNVAGTPTHDTWRAGSDGVFAKIDEGGTLPSRAATGVAFDPIGDRVVLYGGQGPDCANGCAGTYELVLK